MPVSRNFDALDPRDFGADVGAADNSAAFQAALDEAAGGGGGGAVVVPPGIWRVQDLLLDTKVTVAGWGRSSVLKLVQGGTGDVVKSRNFDALTGTNTDGGGHTHQATIQDLVIDGGRLEANVGRHGIAYYGTSLYLTDVLVRHCTDHGLWCEYADPGNVTSGQVDADRSEAMFDRVKLIDNQGGSMNFAGPHDSLITNLFAIKNQTGVITPYNVQILGGAARGLQMIGGHIWGEDFDVGLLVASNNCQCVEYQVEGAQQAQIHVLAENHVFRAGRIYDGGGNGAAAVRVGDATTAVSGTWIDSKIGRAPGGVFDLVNESGLSRFDAEVGLPGGQLFPSNDPAATSRWNIRQLPSGSGFQGQMLVNTDRQDIGFFGADPVPIQSASSLADLWQGLIDYGLLDGASTAPGAGAVSLDRSLVAGPAGHVGTAGDIGVAALDSSDAPFSNETTFHPRAALAAANADVAGDRAAVIASSGSNANGNNSAVVASSNGSETAAGADRSAVISSTNCQALNDQATLISSAGSTVASFNGTIIAASNTTVGANALRSASIGGTAQTVDGGQDCVIVGGSQNSVVNNARFAGVLGGRNANIDGADESVVLGGNGGTVTDDQAVSLSGGAASVGTAETLAHGTPTGGAASATTAVGFRGVTPQPPRTVTTLADVILALQEQGLVL